jgi:hypothetical protein
MILTSFAGEAGHWKTAAVMRLEHHILYMRVACFSMLATAAFSASINVHFVALVAPGWTCGSMAPSKYGWRWIGP